MAIKRPKFTAIRRLSQSVRIHQRKRLISLLQPLEYLLNKSQLTLGELVSSTPYERSSFAIILFSLPFCLPISIPGISIPLGLAIVWLGIKEALSSPIHLPPALSKVKLSQNVLKRVFWLANKLDKSIGRFAGVRWSLMCESKLARQGHSLTAILHGAILCMPLPIPFSNWVPAAAILSAYLGRLFGDGVLVALSYILTLLLALILSRASLILEYIF